MGIRKVLILANGTVSVTQKKAGREGFFGFFNFRNAATWLMFDPSNFINQLAEHCPEENRLVLDGPGTDVTNDKGSLIKSVSALIDGHIGDSGINANFEKIKQFLKKQSDEAAMAGDSLIVCGVGWSRGAFLLLQMKEWLEEKAVKKNINIEAVHLHYIDSVAGGPTDRLRYLKVPSCRPKAPMHLEVHSYLSNTGNLNLWAYILGYLPEKYQVNTPFFSGVLDKTENTIHSVSGVDYRHRSMNWLFPASHEALVGKSSNKIERWAGDLVLANIVRHLEDLSFALDVSWAKKILKRGNTALEQLRQYNPALTSCRKYLDFEQPETTLLGREPTESDNINSCLSMRDFTL
ncbi:TPA: hypothetical protein ACPSKE_002910 [Legionella feeleii]